MAWLATCASVIAFLFYFQQQQGMLYGDAVAHINIARRVFDSKTPGLLQLGTVWLPLPHLLMIPFLISNEMWRRGAGGSVPSLVAYTFAVIGLFRLLRRALSRAPEPDAPARISAGVAALIFAANPNLLYMQSTAMGESLYLSLFIWSIVYFSEALHRDKDDRDKNALTKCGLCLAAACLTRYDGWFLAVAMALAAIVLSVKQRGLSVQPLRKFLGSRSVMKFVLIAAAAPALWLAYNGIVYRNPLEFANGPYSAKAIEARTQSAGNVGHPGTHNLWVAGLYFLKSAEANVAEDQWLQRAWVLVLFAAVLIATLAQRRRQEMPVKSSFSSAFPLLFFLVPLPFYALSVAYGGVPIFVPAWWPFTHYNVRYGLQLLPAFAASFALVVDLMLRIEHWKLRLRFACVLALLVFVGICYGTIWRSSPICLAEAEINMHARNQLESQLALWLQKLPPGSTLLMYLGDHVGALQQAGIPLKQVINEGNHRVWKQPIDPEGLWERALADPAHYADYVVAFDGDRVWQAVKGQHLRDLIEIHVTGQPRVILYRAR